MTLRTSLKAAFLAGTVLGLSAADVAAQQLEEITVTARKREENLQDVPLTITAFTSEAIERSGIKTIEDVAKLTPGLFYDKGFAPQDTRPSIRGLPLVRGKSPVGLLLDGIDISSESISTAGGSSLMNLKLVDVEQIEVVKGPQSALYGRAAFGGAISYVSKKPNLEKLEGSASADGATHNFFEARGAISVPVVEGRVAVRVNAVYSYFDGFYKNTLTGNTIGGDKMGGGSIAVRFKPSDSVDFTFRTAYSDDKTEARPSYYVGQANGLVEFRPLPASAIGQRLGIPPGGAPLPAIYPFAKLGTIDVRGNAIRLSVDPLTGAEFTGGRLRPLVNSLVGDIDLGFAKLSSWTGYTTARSFGRTDADFYGFTPTAVTGPTPGTAEPSAAMFISDIKVKASQVTQELRLGSLDAKPFRWAVGGLYWQEHYKSDNASLSVSPIGKPVGFSAARAYQIAGQPPYSRNARNTNHTSGYGILAYDVTEQIEASVEARYAHEKVDSILGQSLLLNLSPTGAPFYSFTAVVINPTPTFTTNMFTPRGVLKFKFDADNSIYASFSRGKKPGGYLNVSVVSGDSRFARYNPESIDNYEVGFKTSWLENRLRVNGAYFHAVNTDRVAQVLVPDPLSPQGVSTLATNIGKAKIDGAELDLSAALAQGLTASLAYSYINARFTFSDSAQGSAFGAAGPGNCTIITLAGQVLCNTNTNGKRLEFSAKHSLVGSLSYVTALTADWDLSSEVGFQARSQRFLDATNLYSLPGYVNVDAKIGIQNKAYAVTLYVNNLFNDLKPKSGQTSGDGYSFTPPQLDYTAYAADKRQIGVRLKATF